MADEKVVTHSLPRGLFPITATWFDADMHILATEYITGPGVMRIARFAVPVGTQMSFGNGSIEVNPAPPQAVYDACKTGDPSTYDAWHDSLCEFGDVVTGVSHCFKERGHDPPCELMYFLPESRGVVAKIIFDPRPIVDLWIQEVSGDG